MAAGASNFIVKKHELLMNSYDIDLFLSRVEKGPEDECWLWQGGKVKDNYGYIKRKKNGKQITVFTHRLMWTIHNGEIPEGYVIDHYCHSKDAQSCESPCIHRLCINPNHLRAIPHATNASLAKKTGGGFFVPETRLFRREKRGSCRKGHPWIEENMIKRKSGRVDCLACRKIHNNRINKKKVAA